MATQLATAASHSPALAPAPEQRELIGTSVLATCCRPRLSESLSWTLVDQAALAWDAAARTHRGSKTR
jgi:hypothetical protein